MRKINVFAVIGLFFFNLCIMLGFVLSVYGVLMSAWVTMISFLISPALVIVVAVAGLQVFTWGQFILAIVLSVLAFISYVPLIKGTKMILELSKMYLNYNKEMIFY